MKNHKNLLKFMEDIKIYGYDCFEKKKMGYILYPKNINASHICPPKRNNCSNRENENHGFLENIDFYLQNAGQSHPFDENLK